jgi:hypothetical protein
MGFIIFIGLILTCAGWFVYIRAPSWLLFGAPSFMAPIIKLIQVPNDLMEIETISRLRDDSLIVAIIGTAMVILPLLLRRR